MSTSLQVHQGPIGPDPDEQNGRNAIATMDARTPADVRMVLGELTDIAFDRAIARAKVAQKRMVQLFDEVLLPDFHYGNPKQSNGKTAFKKPILYKAGADDLCQMFRLRPVPDPSTPDVVVSTEELVSVTVTRFLIDIAGNVVDRATASCTTKEKRFRKFDGSGWIYQDPRECLNDCYAMAEKRSKDRMVVSSLGLGTYLTSEGAVEKAINDEDDQPIARWTDEEKRHVMKTAADKGMGKSAFEALVQSTLGRPLVGSADVPKLLEAIAKWEPAKKEGKPSAPAQPAAAASAAAEQPAERRDETDEDILNQDRELAEQEGQLPLGGVRKTAPDAVRSGR